MLLLSVSTVQASSEYHPYQPYIWTLRNPTDNRVIAKKIVAGAPSFVVGLRDIFHPQTVGQAPIYRTYWCPSSNPGKSYCTYPGYWFCGYWGCETVVTSNLWQPVKKDEFLEVKYWPYKCTPPTFGSGGEMIHRGSCTLLEAVVLQPHDRGWATGRMWSVFMHRLSNDWSTVVQITRSPLQIPAPIKPNKASEQGSRSTGSASTTTKTTLQNPLSTHVTRTRDTREATPYDLFYRMLDAAFQSLNASEPNLTNSCWLCYDTNPPFYKGVAVDSPFTHSNDPNPTQCRWNTPQKGITLALITGKGICVGSQKLVTANKHICKILVVLKRSYSWAVPSTSGVWACQKTGVSPCISIRHFDFANHFCVQVAVVSRVLYHTDDEIDRYIEGDIQVQKRELITGVTIAVLIGLGATGTAIGVSALVSQRQGLTQLQMTIDEGLQRIEQSISLLEKSLSSLSEVMLQNRRGLDLLLMHQGGLCAALKEQCCLYANYSGVIRDSMAELRERLA